MNKLLLFSFLFLVVFPNCCHAQKNRKENIYVFFDAAKGGSHKIRRGAESPSANDIYIFNVIDIRNGKPRKIVLNSVDLTKSKIENEVFAKENGRLITDLELIKAFDYDTFNDVKFPFKKVYILEFQSKNVYKVTNVVTYIGSDFN